MIILWHNPRCSKSRQALALLEDHGAHVTLRKYLEMPPTRAELDGVLHKLGLPASAVIRSGEGIYNALGLDEEDSEDALVDAMVDNPILIERPIAIHGGRAIIGRPPDSVLALLD